MRHLVIGFMGYSGVGKDECAGRLVRDHSAVHTGLADPAKRHIADLYGFTRDQLYGPSHMRNAGDPRYPKTVLNGWDPKPAGSGAEIAKIPGLVGEVREEKQYIVVEGRSLPDCEPVPGKPGWPAVPYVPGRLGSASFYIETDHPKFFLSPREALQKYCELMNDMYLDSWIRHGIETHQKLAELHQESPKEVFMKYTYDRMLGLIKNDFNEGSNWKPRKETFITCFSDFRHRHEMIHARAMAHNYTPVIVRIKHPIIVNPPYMHRSEVEQSRIPDSAFDFIIENDGTLDDLYKKVDDVVAAASLDGWKHLSASTPLER